MRRSYLLIALLALLIAAFLPIGAASANQLRTPGLSIFVINAPRDLRLFIQYQNSALPEPLEMQRTSRYWEIYYNYVRKHQGIDNKTPQEEAMPLLDLGVNKWLSLIRLSKL